MPESYVAPAEVAEAARVGLLARQKYKRGGTMVGVARARDLANGRPISKQTIFRMKAFFDRHAVDLRSPGAKSNNPRFPSPGVIAWLLWGGEPGRRWAYKIAGDLRRIPPMPRVANSEGLTELVENKLKG